MLLLSLKTQKLPLVNLLLIMDNLFVLLELFFRLVFFFNDFSDDEALLATVR